MYNRTIIAAADGSGDHTSVAQAVAAAAPGDRVFIKPGIYRERVEIFTPGITIEGESAENTVISAAYSAKMKDESGEKLGTFRSYTMLVNTDDITCRRLTIENTSGFGGEVGQGVAVYAEGNRLMFEDCRILGHQDTLFTGPLPFREIEKGGFRGPTEFAPRVAGDQLYRRCYIEGEVDFIFGSARAVFDECELFSLNCGKEINGYVTAASTYSGEEYGYIFRSCRFTSDCPKGSVYLGRPWRDHAQTVLLDCELGEHIRAEAFHDWNKAEARKTVIYALYNCRGASYSPEQAAPFVRILTEQQAQRYYEYASSVLGLVSPV